MIRLVPILSALLTLGSLVISQDALACDQAGLIEATTPAPPYSSFAIRRHLAEVEEATHRSQVDLVAIGDSIVQLWPDQLLQKVTGASSVLNLGVGSDRIQNTLWRLETGGFNRLAVKDVLILVGTNNLGSDSTCSIAAGYSRLLQVVTETFHPARILIVNILPRSVMDKERTSANSEIREIAIKDPARSFVTIDALTPGSLQSDGLHPTEQGYEYLVEKIREQLHSGAKKS